MEVPMLRINIRGEAMKRYREEGGVVLESLH